ncbi:MAG: class II aldolase/adducin family protein [Oscillospiraceae bacterium]|nr:class II aldolase/adducin family protein [Oscillospiraceae bacterium]
MSLIQLVEMSNRYGSNEEFVLAGGGNTSFKEDGVLYVKGSGAQLSDITAEQFVRMNIEKLHGTQGDTREPSPCVPCNSEREDKALADMMAARLPGEEAKRPSIESVLHAMFPYKFVLHVHPPLINGLTCSKSGKEVCEKLFGDRAVWIDLTTPGLFLAQSCNNAFSTYAKEKGKYPQIAILQNHGIFVSADTVEEIDNLMTYVVDTLKSYVADKPSFEEVSYDKDIVDSITRKLRTLYSTDGSATVLFCTNKQVSELVTDEKTFEPVSKPFSPDHIVNCKDEPLYLKKDADIEIEFSSYNVKKGYKPKIVAVQELGFFALSETLKNAERARALFLDAIKIATYAKSFGGVNPVDYEFANFILNWEAEAYRSKA